MAAYKLHRPSGTQFFRVTVHVHVRILVMKLPLSDHALEINANKPLG